MMYSITSSCRGAVQDFRAYLVLIQFCFQYFGVDSESSAWGKRHISYADIIPMNQRWLPFERDR